MADSQATDDEFNSEKIEERAIERLDELIEQTNVEVKSEYDNQSNRSQNSDFNLLNCDFFSPNNTQKSNSQQMSQSYSDSLPNSQQNQLAICQWNSQTTSSSSDLNTQNSSQASRLEKRMLLLDYENDSAEELIKKTILIRLEILMKILHGKGLFFDDKILVAKKCWQNARFEGAIRMNYNNEKIIYQKIKKSRRICLLLMCCKIYLLVKSNKISTRRQIYYEEKELFSSTRCYDLIEQVCAFVNLSRRQLNIVAAGKGA